MFSSTTVIRLLLVPYYRSSVESLTLGSWCYDNLDPVLYSTRTSASPSPIYLLYTDTAASPEFGGFSSHMYVRWPYSP